MLWGLVPWEHSHSAYIHSHSWEQGNDSLGQERVGHWVLVLLGWASSFLVASSRASSFLAGSSRPVWASSFLVASFAWEGQEQT